MKPICVPCKLFYRMKTSGLAFLEGMPGPGAEPRPKIPHMDEDAEWDAAAEARSVTGLTIRVEPGNRDDWQPYKLWVGDLWECRGCGHQLLSGFGRAPIAEHYQAEFQAMVERHNATIRIDDC